MPRCAIIPQRRGMRTLEPKLSRMARRFDEPVPVPVPVPEPEEPEPDGSGGPVVYAGYSFIRRSVRGYVIRTAKRRFCRLAV